MDAMGMNIPHYEITPPVGKMVTLSECKSRYHNGSTGTLSLPLAGSILNTLKRDNDPTLPSNYSPLVGAIREVCEDLLSITDRVDMRRAGDKVTFMLHNYLLLPGCASLQEVSPESCSLCPCSICRPDRMHDRRGAQVRG